MYVQMYVQGRAPLVECRSRPRSEALGRSSQTRAHGRRRRGERGVLSAPDNGMSFAVRPASARPSSRRSTFPKSSSHGRGLRWLKHRRKNRAWEQADEGNVQVRARRRRPLPGSVSRTPSQRAIDRPRRHRACVLTWDLQRAVAPRDFAFLCHAVEVIDGPAGPSTDMTPGTSHSFIPVVDGRRDVSLPAVASVVRGLLGWLQHHRPPHLPDAAASRQKAAAQPALSMHPGPSLTPGPSRPAPATADAAPLHGGGFARDALRYSEPPPPPQTPVRPGAAQ